MPRHCTRKEKKHDIEGLSHVGKNRESPGQYIPLCTSILLQTALSANNSPENPKLNFASKNLQSETKSHPGKKRQTQEKNKLV